MKLKTDNIFQVVELEASPSDVFQALMDEKLHSCFTAMDARIDNREGGVFRTCANQNFGYTLFTETDKRIVQAWSHKDFPEGFFSTVFIDLEKTEHGTRLNLNHIGVPEEACGWLTEGWKKAYWEPLKEFLHDKALVNS
ncbi:MAG: SRPBCC domain-containing protein [Flavobacteriales bacterium]|nr:SRPBCC domain-containing protein [Flavobacteriales bacterium]